MLTAAHGIEGIKDFVVERVKKSGGNPLRKSNRGRKPGAQRICSEQNCNRPVVARGMCSMHYQRWRADQVKVSQTAAKKKGKSDRAA